MQIPAVFIVYSVVVGNTRWHPEENPTPDCRLTFAQ